MEFRPILLSMKRNKFFAALIVIQVALTLAVVSNTLFVTTWTLSEWNLPSGLEHQNLVSVRPQFYDYSVNVEQVVREDLQKLAALPGVVSVTPNVMTPFRAENVQPVFLDSNEESQGMNTVIFDGQINLLDVLELTLIEGRQFALSEEIWKRSSDTRVSPSVVMVSEAMAKVLFPDSTALDKTIWLEKSGQPVKIIGVYSNFMTGETLNGRGMSFRSIIRPQVVWDEGQDPNYLIRVEPGVAPAIFDDIREVMYQTKGRYIYAVESLTRIQKRMYDGRGSNALILVVVSAVLVIITSLGTAGLVSFLVNQRRKQIGTRRALGATKWAVVRYFLLENSLLTGFGLLLGSVLTISIAFVLTDAGNDNLLDVKYMVLTGLLLWGVNAVSVWLPARRAANIPPSIVTRAG